MDHSLHGGLLVEVVGSSGLQSEHWERQSGVRRACLSVEAKVKLWTSHEGRKARDKPSLMSELGMWIQKFCPHPRRHRERY